MKSMPVRRTFLLRAALWHPFGDSSPRSLSSAGLSAPPLVLPAGLQDSGRETPATHAANPNHGAEHVRNTAAAASARGGFMGKVFAVRPRLPWSCCAISPDQKEHLACRCRKVFVVVQV